jgi:hypothetical protein
LSERRRSKALWQDIYHLKPVVEAGVASSHEAEGLNVRADSAVSSPGALVVDDGSFRSKVLAVLGDSEKVAIIGTITKTSKTSLAISSETRIPPSTVYRKLVELRNLGLVVRDRVDVRDGKRLSYYVAAFTEIRLRSADGLLRLEMVPSEATVSRLWISLLWNSQLPGET